MNEKSQITHENYNLKRKKKKSCRIHERGDRIAGKHGRNREKQQTVPSLTSSGHGTGVEEPKDMSTR
jgi:hypothetical protein